MCTMVNPEGIDMETGFKDLLDIDESIIDDKLWAQDLWQFIINGHRKSFLNWCQIVIDMEDKEECIKGWVEAYKREFESTSCNLVMDIGKLKAGVIFEIENYLKKLQKLCTNLSIEMEPVGNLKLCLYQELSLLKKRVQEYELLQESRLKEIHYLKEKQHELCRQLGCAPKVFSESPLPSKSAVEKFQAYIEELEQEKFNRLEEFCDIKLKSRRLAREIKYEPSTEFERGICEENDSDFLVTTKNMKMLKEFLEKLQKMKKSLEEDINTLRQKVEDLWNILDEDLMTRENFTKLNSDYTLPTFEALKAEVNRCAELKKANIKAFVEKYRQDLLDIWTKCLCSLEERKQEFQYFDSEMYSEDLLELYEHKIAVWKRFYAENRTLFQIIEEHKKLWEKAIELERNAAGPNRYKNRGGQLLKEEKERNKLSKRIPLLEAEMLEEAAKFKLVNGEDFRIGDETIEDYINNLHEIRDREKKEKLSARKQQRDTTRTTPSHPSRLRLFPSCSNINLAVTPTSPMKRKMMTPATTPHLKKSRLEYDRKPMLSAKVKSTTTAVTRAKRLSMERKMRIEKCRRISREHEKRKIKHNDLSTEYEQFESEISANKAMRSTNIEPQLIRSSTVILETPKKAPKIIVTQATSPHPRNLLPRTPATNSQSLSRRLKLKTPKSDMKMLF